MHARPSSWRCMCARAVPIRATPTSLLRSDPLSDVVLRPPTWCGAVIDQPIVTSAEQNTEQPGRIDILGH